ncbi:hypothetical protein NC652_015492 [Populus alba x Populus x berolinensis]|nr:hypothetical protein NC652_015492 [Populus alba x Populus x berolinensis]
MQPKLTPTFQHRQLELARQVTASLATTAAAAAAAAAPIIIHWPSISFITWGCWPTIVMVTWAPTNPMVAFSTTCPWVDRFRSFRW